VNIAITYVTNLRIYPMLGKLHDGGLEFIMGYAYSTKIHTAFWWGIPMKGIDCKNKL
jgi:hypothetical protein